MPVGDDSPAGGDSPDEPALEAPAAVPEPVPSLEAESPDAQRARAAEQRLTEVIAAYRQLKQESEAFRDRIRRDTERRYERKHQQLLVSFIEILDNFERALDAAEASGAHSFVEGLILVRTQLVQMLQEQGLNW